MFTVGGRFRYNEFKGDANMASPLSPHYSGGIAYLEKAKYVVLWRTRNGMRNKKHAKVGVFWKITIEEHIRRTSTEVKWFPAWQNAFICLA